MTATRSEGPVEQALRGAYTLERIEKEYIKRVLSEAKGNRSRASAILGIDRKTLYRKLKFH